MWHSLSQNDTLRLRPQECEAEAGKVILLTVIMTVTPMTDGGNVSVNIRLPNGHTGSVFGRFLTLVYSADPSVDHALPSVWSYCTRSTVEFTPVFNGTSCGVH